MVKAEVEAAVAEEDTLLSSLYTHLSSATEKSTNNLGTQQQQQQTTPHSTTISSTVKKTLDGDQDLVMADARDEDDNLP